MAATDERRAKPRVPLGGKLILGRAGEWLDCVSLDISAGGIAAWCPIQGQPGDRVHLKVYLPGTAEALPVEGLLVRQEDRRGAGVCAIHFEIIEPRVIALIETYIREQLRRRVRTRNESASTESVGRQPINKPDRLQGMISKANAGLRSGKGFLPTQRDRGSDRVAPGRLRSLFVSAVESLTQAGVNAKGK